MTFGLKNAGVTYQKAIQKCLESQIGKNIEAYIDDVVVKTTAKDDLITDLAVTFANLRHYRWKLNLEKCVFGVPSSKLLGFMVSHRAPPPVELPPSLLTGTTSGGATTANQLAVSPITRSCYLFAASVRPSPPVRYLRRQGHGCEGQVFVGPPVKIPRAYV
jgi:hypothetical protein